MSDDGGTRRATDSPFGRAIPIARFGEVRILAHWSVLVILLLIANLLATTVLPDAVAGQSALLYWVISTGAAAVFMIALLAHELAHAEVARHYGMPVKRITVWMLGGLTELEGEPPSPRADALVAAAGPATSLAFGAAMALLARLLDSTGSAAVLIAAVRWLAEVNVILAVFNLIPGAPLDGGRLLRALLWWRSGNRYRAGATAARAGRVLGIVLLSMGALEFLTGYPGGIWLALIGWFVLTGAASERYASLSDRVHGLRVSDVMGRNPVAAPGWFTVPEFVDALPTAQSGQVAFPVVDVDGRPVGVLTWADLERIPRERRSQTRLRDVARRGPAFFAISSDSPLPEVVLPLHLRGGYAVVIDDGRLVGLVSEADVSAAAERALPR
jgi:Zn-dependent protease/predicted transcriptional regulator